MLIGKTWHIPATAPKPERLNKHDDTPKNLLSRLRAEKAAKLRGGIYHRVQIDLTYHSNRIEGSRLTHDQTRLIFETNTIGGAGAVRVDDVVEIANHFKFIGMADEIYVINVGGYIGDSTRSEIAYAKATGKGVRYLEASEGETT